MRERLVAIVLYGMLVAALSAATRVLISNVGLAVDTVDALCVLCSLLEGVLAFTGGAWIAVTERWFLC